MRVNDKNTLQEQQWIRLKMDVYIMLNSTVHGRPEGARGGAFAPPGFGHLVKYLVKILSFCAKILKFGQNTNICYPKKNVFPYKKFLRTLMQQSNNKFWMSGIEDAILHSTDNVNLLNSKIRFFLWLWSTGILYQMRLNVILLRCCISNLKLVWRLVLHPWTSWFLTNFRVFMVVCCHSWGLVWAI